MLLKDVCLKKLLLLKKLSSNSWKEYRFLTTANAYRLGLAYPDVDNRALDGAYFARAFDRVNYQPVYENVNLTGCHCFYS